MRKQEKVMNTQKMKIYIFTHFLVERWIFQDEMAFCAVKRFFGIVNKINLWRLFP